MLLLQIALGISNVVLSLPLAVAVAHNAGAAILLMTLVVINSKLNQG
jgi:cytochrome c oxidase assembly protein subunit 15